MKIKLLVVHIRLALSSSVLADGITTDGIMRVAQNLSIPQAFSTTVVGNNFFHRFSDFNLDKEQTVTFTEEILSISLLAIRLIHSTNQSKMATGNSSNKNDITSIELSNTKMISPVVKINNSEITTHSIGGMPSGNIDVHFTHRFDMNNAFVNTAANAGDGGTVTNLAPQLNPSGVLVLANIGNNFDNRLVHQNYCATNKNSSLSKKGKGSLPLRAKDLRVY